MSRRISFFVIPLAFAMWGASIEGFGQEHTDGPRGAAPQKHFRSHKCSTSMEPVHLWLLNRAGRKIDFIIPKAYLAADQHEGGRQRSLHLYVVKDDLSPACSHPDYRETATRNASKVLEIALHPPFEGPPFLERLEDAMYRGQLPDRLPEQTQVANNLLVLPPAVRGVEVLMPSKQDPDQVYFVVCRKPAKPAADSARYSSCAMTARIEPQELLLEVTLPVSDLDQATAIRRDIVTFLAAFISTQHE